MGRFLLTNFPVENKTVFLRVDYNVPLEKSGKSAITVKDNTKITASLPTIRYLLHKNCKIIIGTHLGRPQGEIVAGLKVDPVVKELRRLLTKKEVKEIIKVDNCIGPEVRKTIAQAKPKAIIFLENLRFYKEEERNNPIFAHSLADLAEVYVNDAFAVCHRKDASIAAIAHFIPSLSGMLMETEIKQLSKALHPEKLARHKQVVWIIGGAKLNKVELIVQALKKADYILVGGALAFSFIQAKGIKVGASLVDHSSITIAKRILKTRWFRMGAAKKIILPVDFVVVNKFAYNAPTEIVNYNRIKPQQIALDIGPKTIGRFKEYLTNAGMVVWNGPLGYFEWNKFAHSTKEIGRFLGKLENAVTICGGGETAEAIQKFHLQHNLTHLSTGGGAALTFLSGKKLPGITALENNYKRFKKKL